MGKRTERRKKLEVFSHSTFDPALRQDCMSSEESCDEYVEHVSPSGASVKVQVLRIRGLPWRSQRLSRFYATLDNEETIEEATGIPNKPRRPWPRKERCIGPPKDGFCMPPKGIASWMVSRKWVRDNLAAHPNLEDLLKGVVIDFPDFDWRTFDALGAESEAEDLNTHDTYIPRSDTSYSLAHALAHA